MSLQRFIIHFPEPNDGKGPDTLEYISVDSESDVSAETVLNMLSGLHLGWSDPAVRVVKETKEMVPTLEEFVTARLEHIIKRLDRTPEGFVKESKGHRTTRLREKRDAEALLKHKLVEIKRLTGK